MTPVLETSRTGPPAPSARRILLASLVGTAVEFYDFYIYATAASLVFGPLFFPTVVAVGAAARCLCELQRRVPRTAARRQRVRPFRRSHRTQVDAGRLAAVDGRLDHGRSPVCRPTRPRAGWRRSLLCLLRFGQGFGLGGEWGGAALLAVENAPPGCRARFGMFPQLGAPVGFIAANGAFLLLGLALTPEQFRAWGWRLPFLASALLVAVGLWVRLR